MASFTMEKYVEGNTGHTSLLLKCMYNKFTYKITGSSAVFMNK